MSDPRRRRKPPLPSPPRYTPALDWLVRLDRARAEQDYEAAAEALRQLRFLGMDIRFFPAPEEKEAAHAG